MIILSNHKSYYLFVWLYVHLIILAIYVLINISQTGNFLFFKSVLYFLHKKGGIPMTKTEKSVIIKMRKGCKDIWNSFMAKDAEFTSYDIPYCK